MIQFGVDTAIDHSMLSMKYIESKELSESSNQSIFKISKQNEVNRTKFFLAKVLAYYGKRPLNIYLEKSNNPLVISNYKVCAPHIVLGNSIEGELEGELEGDLEKDFERIAFECLLEDLKKTGTLPHSPSQNNNLLVSRFLVFQKVGNIESNECSEGELEGELEEEGGFQYKLIFWCLSNLKDMGKIMRDFDLLKKHFTGDNYAVCHWPPAINPYSANVSANVSENINCHCSSKSVVSRSNLAQPFLGFFSVKSFLDLFSWKDFSDYQELASLG